MKVKKELRFLDHFEDIVNYRLYSEIIIFKFDSYEL